MAGRSIAVVNHWLVRARWGVLGLAAVFLGLGALTGSADPSRKLIFCCAGAGALLVAALWRERFVLLGASLLCGLALAEMSQGTSGCVGWFAVCVLTVACFVFADTLTGVIGLVAALALFSWEWIFVNPDVGWLPWLNGTIFSAVAAYLLNRQFRLVTQLREAQAGLAERSRVEERNRIAHELHDVIAHTLTVSLLHLGSARIALEHDPDDAARALAEAERLSRESLDEVRATLGVLREDTPSGRAPLPDATQLPELVRRFRDAGADVTLELSGELADVPATTGLALYRIAQESLTNVAKHAAGRRSRVEVHVGANEVALWVASAGRPGAGTGLGRGSMQERARSVGGHCTSGPGGDGWLVEAHLPCHAAATT